jgi:hypothetical protein
MGTTMDPRLAAKTSERAPMGPVTPTAALVT